MTTSLLPLRDSVPNRRFARVVSCVLLLLAALLLAACGGGTSDDEDEPGNNDAPDAVAARLSVQDARVIQGLPPLPSLDPDAPRLSSGEAAVQSTSAPASVPLDVTVDALDGVSALLLRVQDANSYFRVDTPATAPPSAKLDSIEAKDLFVRQLVLQIPAVFTTPRFCVDVAGIDLAGRVSNYQRFCFVLPANDPVGATLPFANAGGAKAAPGGSLVTLDGSGSVAAAGATLTGFAWTQVSGPAVTLRNANTATAQFSAPAAGSTLVFRLTVTDSAARVSSNDTRVNTGTPTIGSLAGTWTAGDTAQDLTITFYDDGTYVKGGRQNDPSCVPLGYPTPSRTNGDGVEWGRFTYDPGNGNFQGAGVFFENDGECGLFNANDEPGQDLSNVVVDGDTLRFTVITDGSGDGASNGETFTLNRAPVSTGIVGSWQLDAPSEPPVVVTFLADNSYVLAFTSADGRADDLARGTEVGTWTIGAGDVFSTTQIVDTAIGFSGHPAGTTLRVDGTGRLELVISGEGTSLFDRLPRPPVITVADLTGVWYGAEAANPDLLASESNDIVSFAADGVYLFGGNDDDPDCDADYGDAAPLQSANGPLDADGNGAELALWTLDTGSGRVNTRGPAAVDSNGSCGLFSRNASFPDNGFLASIVDADTIVIDIADTGALLLKRVPSTAGSLVGAWIEDSTAEVLTFFADGTFFFVYPQDNGGIERGSWSLDAATDVITIIFDPATNPNCIDTVGSEDSCVTETGIPDPETLTFNVDRTVFTIPSDGSPGDPPGGFVYRKVITP